MIAFGSVPSENFLIFIIPTVLYMFCCRGYNFGDSLPNRTLEKQILAIYARIRVELGH